MVVPIVVPKKGQCAISRKHSSGCNLFMRAQRRKGSQRQKQRPPSKTRSLYLPSRSLCVYARMRLIHTTHRSQHRDGARCVFACTAMWSRVWKAQRAFCALVCMWGGERHRERGRGRELWVRQEAVKAEWRLIRTTWGGGKGLTRRIPISVASLVSLPRARFVMRAFCTPSTLIIPTSHCKTVCFSLKLQLLFLFCFSFAVLNCKCLRGGDGRGAGERDCCFGWNTRVCGWVIFSFWFGQSVSRGLNRVRVLVILPGLK
jgi:hypothetical protein